MELTLWVTNICNMRCKYCYVESNKGENSFEKEKIDELISFVSGILGHDEDLYVSFMGGEPLFSYEVIKEVVCRFKDVFCDNKIIYGITTNGLLINDEMIEFFRKEKFAVSLSWDGCEEAHDYNRIDMLGEGTYTRVKEKYELLKSKGLYNVRVRGTFDSNTYTYLNKSIKDLLSVDSEIHALFVPDYFDRNWNDSKLSNLAEIVKDINREKHTDNISVIGEINNKTCTCNGGVKNYHVYVDGSIYPCSFVVNQGNFCIGSIKEGLFGEKIKTLTKEYYNPLVTCEGCDYERFCLSNKCRYLNYLLTGRFNYASEIVCNMENIKLGSN